MCCWVQPATIVQTWRIISLPRDFGVRNTPGLHACRHVHAHAHACNHARTPHALYYKTGNSQCNHCSLKIFNLTALHHLPLKEIAGAKHFSVIMFHMYNLSHLPNAWEREKERDKIFWVYVELTPTGSQQNNQLIGESTPHRLVQV